MSHNTPIERVNHDGGNAVARNCILGTVPGPNNEVDLTKFFRKVNEFWYNEENNEVILGQFSGF